MKRISQLWLLGFFVAAILVTLASAQSQSLGDYARSVRKDKKSTGEKHYDNDNLPRTDKISVVGNAAPEPEATEHKDQAADDQQKPAASEGKKDEKATKDEADKGDEQAK